MITKQSNRGNLKYVVLFVSLWHKFPCPLELNTLNSKVQNSTHVMLLMFSRLACCCVCVRKRELHSRIISPPLFSNSDHNCVSSIIKIPEPFPLPLDLWILFEMKNVNGLCLDLLNQNF